MAQLLTRPSEPTWGARAPWLAAVVAAIWGVVAGLAFAALPGMVVWIADGADGSVAGPLRLGGAVWLAAHRVPIDVDGASLQLPPGGLSVLALLILYRAGRWLARTTDIRSPRDAGVAVAPAAAGYGLAGGLAAIASATDDVTVVLAPALMWTAVVAAIGIGAGILREAHLIRPLLQLLPGWARTVLVGGLGIVLTLCAVGAVLVSVSVVVHSSEINAAMDALGPDRPGAVVLIALNLALVVNAVVWGAAYALGPGFAVGVGTTVSPSVVDVGPVPILPLFGALPAESAGAVGWLVLAGPVAAGCLAGVLVYRRSAELSRVHAAGLGLGAGAVAGVAMSILASLSGGSAGAQRLAEIGPVPWQVALATLLVAGIPAALIAGSLPARALWAHPPWAAGAATAESQSADRSHR